jgi:hypothetical protein
MSPRYWPGPWARRRSPALAELGKCVEAIDRLDPFGTESRV